MTLKAISKSALLSKALAVALITAISQPAIGASNAHVHGQGSLLIAVEGNNLLLEFDLPAADIVGFEHTAVTSEHKAKLVAVEQMLSSPDTVFSIEAGQCHVVNQDIDLPHHSHHDEHHEEESEHHHEEADNDEQGHHESHADVSLRYQLACKSHPAGLTVSLFDNAPSLGEINAQWITDSSQGQQSLSSSMRSLRW